MADLNKTELATWLSISLPTLSRWLVRYGAEFPVLERGTNGKDYRFDPALVSEFLRAKQDEQERSKAEKDEQLAQLKLPFDLPGAEAPPKGASIRDELEAWKLRKVQREEAERSGLLVPSAQISEAIASTLARLSRDIHAFLRQLGREQNWPDAMIRETERRLTEIQHSSVKEMDTILRADAASYGENERQLRLA